MMYSQNRAAQYHAVRSHGQVADASPARLVQVMFEHILSNLAIAQGCMERIRDNVPYADVVAKGKAMGKAVRLIGQLDASLNMEQGGQIAENLHNLYLYMLGRLTTANLHNDAQIVIEVSNLVRKIKTGWDQIVKDER
ncbi:MAG TPA: flagellar export chaperone FliS [Steroidobacteraceae bacterium]|jgi:flagellar protein FliS|nr:flagellar export chaperone FliS [Steroidobacteraceae bacterium]